MRQQLELRDFAEKIRHTRFNKHDFIADTRSMHLTTLGALAIVDGPNLIKYDINNHCHGQIATKLGIPKAYYDRLWKDHRDILSNDVTALFRREPERRMIRTLDGVARGYLSDSFRTDMDNYDVAEAALPILEAVPDMNILSLGVTDTRMYIKAQFPHLRGTVNRKVGDVVTGGVVISNSEVGCGALNIEVLIYKLSCLNGMIGKSLVRKFHVGAKQGVSDEAYEVLSQETRDKSAEAMRAIIADVVTAATDEAKFQLEVDKLSNAAEQRIDGDVPKAIEVLGNRLKLNQEEQSGILSRLIEGGDLSRWGLANAVTRAASDVDDYDRATELERAGGKVIELNAKEWTEVSLAA